MKKKTDPNRRRKVYEFAMGEYIQVPVRFAASEQSAAMKLLLESTNELWMDDAIHTVLETVANMPGQHELVLAQQTHLHLLRDYASRLNSEFSRALKNAEQTAQSEITKMLLERGLFE